MFGTPGPDGGYALTLVDAMWERLVMSPDDERSDVATGLVATALRRASLDGRAPITADLQWAAVYWGMLRELGPIGSSSPCELSTEERWNLFGGCAHEFELQREIASHPPEGMFALTPQDLGRRAGGGVEVRDVAADLDGGSDRVEQSPGVKIIRADD